MRHLTKLLFIALLCPLLGFANNSQDCEPYCDPCELYCGGLWLGSSVSNESFSGWTLTGGYSNACFLIDIGYSYQNIGISYYDDSFDINFADTAHVHSINSHIGLRNRVCCSNLFLTYGGQGSVGIISGWGTDTTYEIGVFVGLDYQLSRHFMISGKIAPYTYEYLPTEDHVHHVFQVGSFTVAYVF